MREIRFWFGWLPIILMVGVLLLRAIVREFRSSGSAVASSSPSVERS